MAKRSRISINTTAHGNKNAVSKSKMMNKYSKLYHLLTDKGTFKIEDSVIKDYNGAIDIFLEKE